MKKVLFTHSYFLRLDPKQWKTMQPYAPLATLYAASKIRDTGYSVKLFDPMFSYQPDEILKDLNSFKPDIVVVYDDGFNYLTKMCLTNMREASFSMIRFAKEFGATVIVSGSDASDHYDKYLDKGADYIILGEAEITLSELIAQLHTNLANTSDEIAGLIFRKNNQTIKTAKREVLRDLDKLPSPAWDLIHIDEYRKRWKSKNGYFSLNMVTTRGCPYKCNWCAKPIYGNRYNSHSPDQIVKELKYLLSAFAPDHIWFCDDIFGLKPDWIKEFSSLVKLQNLSFRYKIQSRVDLLLDEDTVKALAESGCDTVWLGAESGSQKILDAMDKGITTKQIREARNLLKKYKIKCAFFLQFGYLGETKKEENETIEMVLDLMPDEIGISVSYPLPGTKFYEKVKAEIKNKTNWTDSDEMAMMFRENVHPNYYKYLQRYLHKAYQKEKGINNLIGIFRRPIGINTDRLRSILAILYYFPAAYLERKKIFANGSRL